MKASDVADRTSATSLPVSGGDQKRADDIIARAEAWVEPLPNIAEGMTRFGISPLQRMHVAHGVAVVGDLIATIERQTRAIEGHADLLETLQLLVRHCDLGGYDGAPVDLARAALSKATA